MQGKRNQLMEVLRIVRNRSVAPGQNNLFNLGRYLRMSQISRNVRPSPNNLAVVRNAHLATNRNTGSTQMLFRLVKNGDYRVLKMFLDRFPPMVLRGMINARLDGWTPLMHASHLARNEKGRFEVIKLLLEVPGVDVNARDRFGRSALILATVQRSVPAIKLLLGVPGIDVNAFCVVFAGIPWQESGTPLTIAIDHVFEERPNGTTIIRLLLRHPKIEVDAPLLYAADYGLVDVVKMMLEAGADVNARNEYGDTALTLCSLTMNDDIVKILLATPGIDVNIRNKDGDTALLIITKEMLYDDLKNDRMSYEWQEYRIAILRDLLKARGINIDIKDRKTGQNALMLASHAKSRLGVTFYEILGKFAAARRRQTRTMTGKIAKRKMNMR